MQRFVFDPPERFVVGTVGQPGERAFYLQAAQSGQLVTIGLEKAEVTALAEGLSALLGQVGQQQGVPVPAAADVEVDLAPLEAPFEEDFHLGQLTVSWDGRRVFVEAAGLSQSQLGTPVSEEDLDSLRVGLSIQQTRAFIERARSIVAAGRPSCVLCGRPDGPDGHFCPRLN
ncbi:DUF3090 family protein [Frankia sp. AgB1.9]|jgi:uncharacterized repeat protein (TIGR03847 family)|uniref:DUF3090 family protein n=1 Tax=unclassified Frankia TaxID=2632575 RepID=UPI001933F8EF|nr:MULTISPECIES: DUF3090 family protein [unclassified Frankia]MBL7491807.1 DUF3090 family protein [Frankia sp. AgW1.1]MBL7550701.1 DUF3090 family protein [Frankia sp. AgB1.9]MBL7623638.1 DUF3090 family protein [Frankia sp. AgB1.8]